MAYIAKTDGTRENIDANTVTLKRAKEIVGGWVERVCPKKTPSVVFLCNEEGHLRGLPLNAQGMMLYGAPVAGDIIVMTRAEAREWM